jgi:hypothetical protein
LLISRWKDVRKGFEDVRLRFGRVEELSEGGQTDNHVTSEVLMLRSSAIRDVIQTMGPPKTKVCAEARVVVKIKAHSRNVLLKHKGRSLEESISTYGFDGSGCASE